MFKVFEIVLAIEASNFCTIMPPSPKEASKKK
jgi:hypothetical protein